MATLIKETPVLRGEDAEKFLEAIEKNETDKSKRVPKEEYEKSKKLYKKMIAKANF